jgi:hypothetical protein
MTEFVERSAGAWGRFDRYIVQDGYIRPAPGARFDVYDPWASYGDTPSDSGAREPPYGSLLMLVQSIELKPRPGPGPLLTLSADSEALVTEWCATHGLLGILPLRAQSVTLAPRYDRLPDLQGHWVPWQHQFLRTHQGWIRTGRWGVRSGSVLQSDGTDRNGALVLSSKVPEQFSEPGVLMQDLRTGAWKTEPLTSTWARFFPDVPDEERETYDYPLPNTESFWHLYAEPVHDFVEAAGLMLRAVQVLGSLGESPTTSGTKGQLGEDPLFTLNLLLGSVGPAAVLSDQGLVDRRWNATSLLGSFAMMALEDLAEQRAPRTCGNCGKLFVTRAYQGRYCSDTCRGTAQKRRYRERKRLRTTP